MAPDEKEFRSRMELYKQGKPYREESKLILTPKARWNMRQAWLVF
jgi:hypothetical protein